MLGMCEMAPDNTKNTMGNNDDLRGKSIDDITREIQTEIEYRRSIGDYPIGLEQQLEQYFADMMRSLHEHDRETAPMANALLQLNHHLHTFSIDIPTSSRIPGIGLLHKIFGKLNRRHSQNLADQIHNIGQAVMTIHQEFLELTNQIYEHDARESARVLSSVKDQLAVVDHLAHLSLEIEERLRKLEERD